MSIASSTVQSNEPSLVAGFQLWFALQVFFIKDGIMFPDLVHSLRPNPKTHIQEGWRIMDFLANYPESTNMVKLVCICTQNM